MKIEKIIGIVLLSLFLTGCGFNNGSGNRPCNIVKNDNPGYLITANTDPANNVYFKYLTDNAGLPLTDLSSATQGTIFRGTSYNLPIVSSEFNHIYFYSDQACTVLIGKLIFYSPLPAYGDLGNVNVTVSGTFNSAQSNINITSLASHIETFKYTTLASPSPWDLTNPQSTQNIGNCGVITIPTVAPNNYYHLHFVDPKNSSTISAYNYITKVILYNNNPIKIATTDIVLR